MQKIRATERIRTRIATSLTEDMTNSLSSINISSELAKTKVDTDRERTKEYIAQISETSNRMVQAMYDMVWSIDPKNDTMMNTIERMKSFAVEVESLHNVDIIFEIEEAAAKLNLDMAHRYELLSVFKEAISNATKHSVARHIQVSLRLKNSKFFLLIEDDGNGFDINKATLGRGMNDMKRRAADIKASLHIESEQNTGTIVKLEMPI
jgi:Signal transduction histidine kinase